LASRRRAKVLFTGETPEPRGDETKVLLTNIDIQDIQDEFIKYIFILSILFIDVKFFGSGYARKELRNYDQNQPF
jgi:hypothetical protein